MTTEEAIKTMEIIEKSYTHDPAETAIHMAIAALRAQQEAEKNEPLTLDELRKMPPREWLWIELLGENFGKAKSAYYQVQADYSCGEALCCGYPGLGYEFEYQDYGKTWLVYRHKPKEETT